MPFIDIKVIEGVFTVEEKREMVERVSEAVIAVEGEALRPLTHTAITETSLDALAKMTTLTWLNLEETKFTYESIDKLRNQLPNCLIVW